MSAPALPASQVIVLSTAEQPCAPVQLPEAGLILASVHKAGRGPGHMARTPLVVSPPPPPPPPGTPGQLDFRINGNPLITTL